MSFFSALKQKLKPKTSQQYVSGFEKTQTGFGAKLKALITASPVIDEHFYAQINDVLLKSDVGVETSSQLIQALKKRAKSEILSGPKRLDEVLH